MSRVLIGWTCFSGNKIEEMLPAAELVLSEQELGNLAASSNFQYLIKLVYEYAYNNYWWNNC